MDGTTICVLKESDKKALDTFLQGPKSGGLKSQIGIDVLGYLAYLNPSSAHILLETLLTYQPLEGQLPK
jgi:hypothetical protein